MNKLPSGVGHHSSNLDADMHRASVKSPASLAFRIRLASLLIEAVEAGVFDPHEMLTWVENRLQSDAKSSAQIATVSEVEEYLLVARETLLGFAHAVAESETVFRDEFPGADEEDTDWYPQPWSHYCLPKPITRAMLYATGYSGLMPDTMHEATLLALRRMKSQENWK
ncbi:MAG: hypothetical protein ACK47B_18900 [Armatimonadota bacterium]